MTHLDWPCCELHEIRAEVARQMTEYGIVVDDAVENVADELGLEFFAVQKIAAPLYGGAS